MEDDGDNAAVVIVKCRLGCSLDVYLAFILFLKGGRWVFTIGIATKGIVEVAIPISLRQ